MKELKKDIFKDDSIKPSVYVIGENSFKHELDKFGINVINLKEEEYLHESHEIGMSGF